MSAFVLSTIQNPDARARARARARVGVLLSTIEKSARPSASLKGHRIFEFSFWDYMSAFLFRDNTELLPRARARARVGS